MRLGRIAEANKLRVGLDVNRSVGDDRRAVERRTDVVSLMIFFPSSPPAINEVTVFIADVEFAIGHKGGAPCAPSCRE